MLVQIYGVTTASDAAAVDRLGADRIGVVVDEGIDTWDSVDEATAQAIVARIERATAVALSLSTDPDRILATARLLRPAVVHLARAHLMTTDSLERVRVSLDAVELMATVPVRGPESVPEAQRLAALADDVLVDSAHPETGVVGATGLVHDWALSAEIARLIDVPVILAGGLGPEDVRDAIVAVRPAGVDSETRTSRAEDRRRKDLAKVEAFISIAKATPAATRRPAR